MFASVAIVALFAFSGITGIHSSAYSSQNSDVQKKISLTISNGIITNAGSQDWRMKGGSLVMASIAALPSVSSWTDIEYSLNATVNGLASTGRFKLHMQGLASNGNIIHMRIDAAVVGSIPAVCFPSYSVNGTCAASDTSEIPAFFLVAGYMRSNASTNDSPTLVSLAIEVAALNPFGGPIVISSATDSSILIVATYNHARTFWQGVQVAGILTGTMGKDDKPVSGSFVENIATTENYLKGTATDAGQISMFGMAPGDLNSKGSFHGTSTIPTTGTMPCPASLGLPPGTCVETGFDSRGSFDLMNHKSLPIEGTYDVQWPAPSIFFGGSINAKIDTGSN
jgi:hypothetical protein